ncbi:unnamed protein product [Coffea canephora]|uniref:DH200=94 genomic scaffold, scaffold_1023 n=1 Tax=Coffea canephora TaxID=49390 RepID=A0A068VHR0_COFCA|nr:unnamed protein product [Coffea canephora]
MDELRRAPIDSAKGKDDHGRPKRTGTFYTATAHIITTVVGLGVLSSPRVISQIGWFARPMALISFSLITLFTSTILADFYRFLDSVSAEETIPTWT